MVHRKVVAVLLVAVLAGACAHGQSSARKWVGAGLIGAGLAGGAIGTASVASYEREDCGDFGICMDPSREIGIGVTVAVAAVVVVAGAVMMLTDAKDRSKKHDSSDNHAGTNR
jgi:hypothetical protein